MTTGCFFYCFYSNFLFRIASLICTAHFTHNPSTKSSSFTSFHLSSTLLHSFFLLIYEGQRELSMFVWMWVCQHVEMSFDLTVLFKCEFPSCPSFPLTVQWLGFWLFHLSVAEHHLINNDWLIDFSFSVPSINPLSFCLTISSSHFFSENAALALI